MTARDEAWARHDREWRDPAQVWGQWGSAAAVEPSLLRHRVRGRFWEALDTAGVTLFVTREYEHLAMALTVARSVPEVSYLRVPHPSGLVYDRSRRVVYLASTRNPNQIVTLAPVSGLADRGDTRLSRLSGRPLVPIRTDVHQGSAYLHDLALVGGVLHANAVGHNTVVRVGSDGRFSPVWWPRSMERDGKPLVDCNLIQLNSIAAGPTLERSFFSASASAMGTRRPGHKDFPVDRCGVVFSGRTREPVVRGLTRPHSARLHRRRLWVANSGYGEVGLVRRGQFEPVFRVKGWTRGLAFAGNIAFVGVSRVLPRFRHYAPGVDADRSHCAVYAVEVDTGNVVGSLRWPDGNQIFAIDVAPRRVTTGFPFALRRTGRARRAHGLFYAFQTEPPT